jgi:hypothetical protein
VIPVLSLAFLAFLAGTDPGPAGPGVRAKVDRVSREITLTGLDPAALQQASRAESRARWEALCRIFVRASFGVKPEDAMPIRGTYRVNVQDATLRFRSRYPLDQPGYRVVIDALLLGETERKRWAEHGNVGPLVLDVNLDDASPSPPVPTVVTSVFPSAKVLPENLLRFYIHFSAPMGRGEAYRHIHLVDQEGKPVADPFLEIDEELWSADGRRFTLLFAPGRIKRGLKPHEDMGPALREGRTYTLQLDRQWRDALGNPLAADHRVTFRTGPADRSPPSPQDWKVLPPRSGTRDPLEIRFPEPMDEALARRLIKVRDSQGKFIEGKVGLDLAETLWRLMPDSRWQTGEYKLVVGADLEDPAGNAVGRPFEVDMTRPIPESTKAETVSRTFRIDGGGRAH